VTSEIGNLRETWRWGVPVWRDGGAYPECDTTPLSGWRWQFLRRRQDYREDWLLHFDRAYRHLIAAFAGSPLSEGMLSWEDHFSRAVSVPEIADKYGTRSILLDPAIEYLSPGLFRPRGGILRAASKTAFQEYEHEMIMPYLFDLKEPLAGQLKAAEVHLGRLRDELGMVPEGRRRQVRKWPLYLRVLDARDAGATFDEIGAQLICADPESTVEEYDKQAALEPKVWAKKKHEQALVVAFNFPA
jgi:hypothetical protein